MERTEGVRRLLSSASAYSFFQALAGAGRLRRWLADNFWKIPPVGKVIDIGCGPGDAVPFLPATAEYVGFDPSAAYIDRAVERFGARPQTTFLRGVAGDFRGDPRFRGASVVLCVGVLHHLDDREAAEVLDFAREILSEGGAFRCVEPCFVARQGLLSRWIMGLDRGLNIRNEEEWAKLMKGSFGEYSTRVTANLIRLPYIHILLEGLKRDPG